MLVAATALLIIIIDQVTKILARANIAMGEKVDFIPWFINLTHTENAGAAWGILDDSRWVFMTVSLIAIVAIIVFLIKFYRRHTLLNIGLAFILGGGIGNMIDRIFAGTVTDFFYFTFFDFPVFNVADMFVTFGTVIIAVYLLFFEPGVEARLKKAGAETQAADAKPNESEGLSDTPAESVRDGDGNELR